MQSAVERLTNMHPDNEAQLQNILRNFFHQLYVQWIIRNTCLAILLHRNLHCSSCSSLLAAIARALTDLVGHILCTNS